MSRWASRVVSAASVLIVTAAVVTVVAGVSAIQFSAAEYTSSERDGFVAVHVCWESINASEADGNDTNSTDTNSTDTNSTNITVTIATMQESAGKIRCNV